ncbi:MAG: sulfurtransferase TusA family protein [Egibacteraceae bacterium]
MLDLAYAEQECGDSALQIVRRELNGLRVGQVLEIQTTVAEHAFIVRAWARKTGRTLLDDRTEGRQTRILLERTANG